MRDDRERLRDILDAIDRIELEAGKGWDAFEETPLIQTWIVHNLLIIGEAAGKVTAAVQEAHPEIPWGPVVALRNVLVHEYFGVDLEEVWAAVQRDLPNLKHHIAALLRELEAEAEG